MEREVSEREQANALATVYLDSAEEEEFTKKPVQEAGRLILIRNAMAGAFTASWRYPRWVTSFSQQE